MKQLALTLTLLIVIITAAVFVSCPAVTPAPLTVASISPAGGRVVSPDGLLTLEVPPHAVKAATRLRIRALDVDQLRRDYPRQRFLGAYEMGPPGTTFKVPLTVRARLSFADLPTGGGLPAGLVLLWVEEGGQLVPMDGQVAVVDRSTRTVVVSAPASHFSTYGVSFDETVLATISWNPDVQWVGGMIAVRGGLRTKAGSQARAKDLRWTVATSGALKRQLVSASLGPIPGNPPPKGVVAARCERPGIGLIDATATATQFSTIGKDGKRTPPKDLQQNQLEPVVCRDRDHPNQVSVKIGGTLVSLFMRPKEVKRNVNEAFGLELSSQGLAGHVKVAIQDLIPGVIETPSHRPPPHGGATNPTLTHTGIRRPGMLRSAAEFDVPAAAAAGISLRSRCLRGGFTALVFTGWITPPGKQESLIGTAVVLVRCKAPLLEVPEIPGEGEPTKDGPKPKKDAGG